MSPAALLHSWSSAERAAWAQAAAAAAAAVPTAHTGLHAYVIKLRVAATKPVLGSQRGAMRGWGRRGLGGGMRGDGGEWRGGGGR